MSEAYLGEIRMFPAGWAPRGWAPCDGAILSIQSNTALFSLLGTSYGGNGSTTFALPDLRGATPMHFGTSSDLAESFSLGERGGAATVTLTAAQLPSHTHPVLARSTSATTSEPSASAGWAAAPQPAYGSGSTTPMSTAAMSASGGGQPHENMQPYLTVYFAICVAGIYPSRS